MGHTVTPSPTVGALPYQSQVCVMGPHLLAPGERGEKEVKE